MSARIAGIVLWLLATVVASAQAQTVEYVHTDALGSVVAVTNASRTVLERREYEPYGSQLTPAVSNGPGYTGHVQDAATGLVYMQQRYYDAQIGRFLSVDPVAATIDDLNRYSYARNNPLNNIDPTGEFCVPCLIPALTALEKAVVATIAIVAAIGAGAAISEGGGEKDQPSSAPAAPTSPSDASTPLSTPPPDFEPNDSQPQPKRESYSGRYEDGQKAYRTNVPRDSNGNPAPDPAAEGPHSRLQPDAKDANRTYSATEFNAQGEPVKRTDFAGRKGEPVPHEHPWDGKKFGDKQPLQ